METDAAILAAIVTGAARQIGTSHQLLSHYLQQWEKWQPKELRREATEIRALAEAETRPWARDALS